MGQAVRPGLYRVPSTLAQPSSDEDDDMGAAQMIEELTLLLDLLPTSARTGLHTLMDGGRIDVGDGVGTAVDNMLYNVEEVRIM